MDNRSNAPLLLDEEQLPVSERVALAYGDADLGTRFCVSGGEALEIPIRRYCTCETDDEPGLCGICGRLRERSSL